jgi:crossover junction endodeoxyribonuclease RuvC
MFVLGVDPGLTRTGYAVLSDRNLRPALRTVGVIRTSRGDTLAERLAELYTDLSAVVAEHEPDVMAIESVFVNQNLQTAMSVARASGVIILVAAERRLPVFEYTPSAVKSAVCGYGSAAKDQVQEMIMRRLDLPSTPQPADAADAVAVALCHMQSARLRVAQ